MILIKRSLQIILLTLLGFLAYLMLWPVNFEPKAWNAPKAPALTGQFQPVKAELTRNSYDIGIGPEDLNITENMLFTGLKNGDIQKRSMLTSKVKTLGNTGGRPLSVYPIYYPAQEPILIIADAKLGLLKMHANTGEITVLMDKHEGKKLLFVDHVAVSKNHIVYFSDASQRWGIGHAKEDILEHHKTGRIFRYDLKTGEAKVVLDQLQFANGVALSAAEDYLLVNETGEYRVHKLWLKGDKAGSHEVLLDNLPGMPDNISHHKDNRFWVALFTGRNAILDGTADKPFVRKMMYRLPEFMQPQPKHEAMALEINGDTGKPLRLVHITGEDNYTPVTDVEVFAGGALLLGSLSDSGLATITFD